MNTRSPKKRKRSWRDFI